MSIQTYINKLADIIIYRSQHLEKFTDHIYISQDSLFSFTKEKKPVIYYEDKPNTYELCDIMYSIIENPSCKYLNRDIRDLLSMLILYCPEHESTRELRLVPLE